MLFMQPRLGALWLALMVTAMALGTASAHAVEAYGPADVIDGDTLAVAGVRFRLQGMDAPEKRQACDTADKGRWDCGQAATEAMRRIIGGRTVFCFGTDRDRERIVGSCRLLPEPGDTTQPVRAGGHQRPVGDVAAVLVQRGLAWASVEYPTGYAGEEAEARLAAIGIWRAPETQTAWDYRHGGPDAQAPPGRPIKANRRADRTCIFHVPGSRFYRKTRIKLEEGDQWVASVAEATSLGCRPPQS